MTENISPTGSSQPDSIKDLKRSLEANNLRSKNDTRPPENIDLESKTTSNQALPSTPGKAPTSQGKPDQKKVDVEPPTPETSPSADPDSASTTPETNPSNSSAQSSTEQAENKNVSPKSNPDTSGDQNPDLPPGPSQPVKSSTNPAEAPNIPDTAGQASAPDNSVNKPKNQSKGTSNNFTPSPNAHIPPEVVNDYAQAKAEENAAHAEGRKANLEQENNNKEKLNEARATEARKARLDGDLEIGLKEGLKNPAEIIDIINGNSYSQMRQYEKNQKYPNSLARFKAFLNGENDFKVDTEGKIEDNKVAQVGRKILTSIFNRRVAGATAAAVGMGVLTGGLGLTAGFTVGGSIVGRFGGEMATGKAEANNRRKIIEAEQAIWTQLKDLSAEHHEEQDSTKKAAILKKIVDLYHKQGEDASLAKLGETKQSFASEQMKLDKTKGRWQKWGEVAGLLSGLGAQHLKGMYDAIDLDSIKNLAEKGALTLKGQSMFHGVQLGPDGQSWHALLKELAKHGDKIPAPLLNGVSEARIALMALIERGLPVLAGAYLADRGPKKITSVETDYDKSLNEQYGRFGGQLPSTTEEPTPTDTTTPEVATAPASNSETTTNTEDKPEKSTNPEDLKTPEERKKYWQKEAHKRNLGRLPESAQTWLKKIELNGQMVDVESNHARVTEVDWNENPPRVYFQINRKGASGREFEQRTSYDIDQFLDEFLEGRIIDRDKEASLNSDDSEKVSDTSQLKPEAKSQEDKSLNKLVGEDIPVTIKKGADGRSHIEFHKIDNKRYRIIIDDNEYFKKLDKSRAEVRVVMEVDRVEDKDGKRLIFVKPKPQT